MKNYKYIRIALVLALTGGSFTSCESFLNEKSESQRVMDNFYRTKSELEAGLYGVYAQAKNIFAGSSLPITIVGTDEIYASNTSGNQSIADRYLYPASHPTTTNWYQVHYQVIQSANIIINRAPQVPHISEADMQSISAEARVIRAWSYFRLVQTFGRVPLVLEETELFNFRIRRNPIAEIYQAIIDDLEYAVGDDVLTRNVVTGRINHWVAKGLLAKVYLTLGTSIMRRPQPIDEYRELPFDPAVLFAECRDLCDEIIASGKYELVNDYGNVFIINNKNNSESLWELQYSTSPNAGSGWSKNFGVQQQNNSNAYAVNAMCGRGYFCPLPSFYRYFRLGDARRTFSIADYRVQFDAGTLEPINLNYLYNETITSGEKCDLDTDDPDLLAGVLISTPAARLRISKYRWGVGSDPSQYWKESLSFESDNAPNNVIVLRYADILLMRIESDMLCNQGVAGDVSLGIMNEKLLKRARGWDPLLARHVTQDEMLESFLAPIQEEIDAAQALFDFDPNQENTDNLASARARYDLRKARCLIDYTRETLTYDELMKQRACELCFEFHRWFDLCRTGTLHMLVPARIVNPSAIPAVNFRFNVNYLMPIPTYELDLATDKTLFYQNPGY